MYNIDDIYDDIKNGLSKVNVHKKYGGYSVYITRKIENYKNEIIKEFNGYNHHYLADKFNLSLNTIYRIINNDKRK